MKIKNKINKELLKVKSWLEINKLALNFETTNSVVFHPSRKRLLNDIQIKLRYVNFLSVLMDEQLSWKFHIT